MKKSIYILLCILLSACAATTIPAPSATPKAIDSATPEPSNTPTVAVTATVKASSTPISTKTIEINPTGKAINALATKIAKFSVNCKDSFSPYKESISPNDDWLAISCDYVDYQTLEIGKYDGKRWVLKYQDYLSKKYTDKGEIPMGGLFPLRWSNDGVYLYFTSHINFDVGGGACFYGFGSQGLYRIRVADGVVSAILPVTPSVVGYQIAFSPTGRRLAYQGAGALIILDLQTGNEINLEKNSVGTLTWSLDGSKLAYATCEEIKNGDDYSVKRSAVKIFSVEKQASRTVLEMDKILLRITAWDTNDIMRIFVDDNSYPTDGQLFDLNTNQWITPTPTP